MPSYGWSYLVVTLVEAPAATPTWTASDASTFTSELEMFRELGVTGWELVAIRELPGRVHYYFKRPRA